MQIFGIKGHHNSGKTSLAVLLIQWFMDHDFSVCVHKSTNKDQIDIDHPGKDTWRLKKAGAKDIGLAFLNGFFYQTKEIISLKQALDNNYYQCDFLIVEGAKELTEIPSILCLRDENDLEDFKNQKQLFAFSGIISKKDITKLKSKEDFYKDLSFFNLNNDITPLADLCLRNAMTKDQFLGRK